MMVERLDCKLEGQLVSKRVVRLMYVLRMGLGPASALISVAKLKAHDTTKP